VLSWFLLRLDMIICLIMVTGCAAVISLRSSADAVLLTLMLQYLLTIQWSVKATMTNFGEIERKMVSAQRLYNLREIP